MYRGLPTLLVTALLAVSVRSIRPEVSADTSGGSFVVATLNSLAVSGTNRGATGFPIPEESCEKVMEMKTAKPSWLMKTLNDLADSVDIISLQEADEPLDLESLKFKGWEKVVASQTDSNHDGTYLLWNADKLTKKSCKTLQDGILFCELQAGSTEVGVLAGHAPSSGFYWSAEWDVKPNLILMDANANRSKVLSKIPGGDGDWDAFPQAGVVTSLKTADKFRKITQGIVNTQNFHKNCDRNGVCLTDFHGVENTTTCDQILCKPAPQYGCCEFTPRAHEANEQCKYIARFCGNFTHDYWDNGKGEMDILLKDLKKQGINWNRGDIVLRDLTKYVSGGGALVTKKTQEDLIVYNKEHFTIDEQTAIVGLPPSQDDAAWKTEGDLNGYPNKNWPSDHLLVMATLTAKANPEVVALNEENKPDALAKDECDIPNCVPQDSWTSTWTTTTEASCMKACPKTCHWSQTAGEGCEVMGKA